MSHFVLMSPCIVEECHLEVHVAVRTCNPATWRQRIKSLWAACPHN